MNKKIPIDNKILDQYNQRCENCTNPAGTRCESHITNCPYNKQNIELKLKNATKLE